MRIYNISNKNSFTGCLVLLGFMLFFLIINFLFYGNSVDWNLSIKNFFEWNIFVIQSIFNPDVDLRFAYAFFIFAPIVFLILSIWEYFAKKECLTKNQDVFDLKYINLTDDKLFFKFNTSNKDFTCTYQQILNVDLEICTQLLIKRYGVHNVISEIVIKFDVMGECYILYNIPKNIYKIIGYLAKVKAFKYKITGSGIDLQKPLTQDIEEFLANGCQLPNIHKKMKSFYIVLIILFLLLGIFTGFSGVFSLIFDAQMYILSLFPLIFFGVPIVLIFLIYKNR